MVSFRPAEPGGDFIAFGDGRGVAPEFGRADNVAVFVQGHEAMLLAADADGFDLARPTALACFEGAPDGACRRRRARCAGVVPWRRVASPAAGHSSRLAVASDFAVARIDDQGFGGLRAAIDSQKQRAHG